MYEDQNPDFFLGRSCPTEPQVDPATGAKLCELPHATQTIQPSISSSHETGLPRVGLTVDSVFSSLILAIMITLIIKVIVEVSIPKRCKHCGSVVDYNHVGYDGSKAYCHRCKKIV